MPKLERPDNDWLEWYAALFRFQHERGGRAPYLPSPAEIDLRKRQVRWLQEQGFCRSFIVNVMEFDHPTFPKVQRMVEQYGPEETYRRCREFLFKTEYKIKEEFDARNCRRI